MEPVVAGSAALSLVAVLAALSWAYHLAADAGARELAEREARHVAERALDVRLRTEAEAALDGERAENARLRALVASSSARADSTVEADRRLADAARPHGDRGPDLKLLLDAVAPAPGGDPRSGAAGAAHAGGAVGA